MFLWIYYIRYVLKKLQASTSTSLTSPPHEQQFHHPNPPLPASPSPSDTRQRQYPGNWILHPHPAVRNGVRVGKEKHPGDVVGMEWRMENIGMYAIGWMLVWGINTVKVAGYCELYILFIFIYIWFWYIQYDGKARRWDGCWLKVEVLWWMGMLNESSNSSSYNGVYVWGRMEGNAWHGVECEKR